MLRLGFDLVVLSIAISVVPAAADVGIEPGVSIANDQVRAEKLVTADRCTGFRVTADKRRVADIRLGPGNAIAAAKVTTTEGDGAATLRLAGLSVRGRAVRLADGSYVSVRVRDGSPWPEIEFDLAIEAFDQDAWQELVGGTLPFHYLICEMPGATMFYQGGGLIPSPEVDPFPMSAVGYMAGEWAEGWSYAPAMAGWAVPAVGLWEHGEAKFVAYDFTEARHTDRSSKYIASAYCTGNGGDPFFCLVHPYQKGWVELTYPEAPSRAASRFELIYSFDLPDTADPNLFVLERLWREKRDLLPPVPRTSDLAWIPEYDGTAPSGGLEPAAVGTGLKGLSGPEGLAGVFVELGSTMLGNPFIMDGVMRGRTIGPPEGLERLRTDVEYLMERCKWVEIGGDRCATWVHPAEGKFQDRWGGERCAGNHHPSTFQIGAGIILLYEETKDERLLPYIDGVYNWCKHYLFTRNGVCDLPWAMFCRAGTAAGENFLLTYRRVFKDDPQRGVNYDEALQLARMSLYKVLWFYTTDPDLSDDLDPTFLNQAVNDRRWCGRVTWNECGWVVRTMVPIYCETGDPFLKYVLRGALERYYAGFREDGGVAENIQIFGELEPKGIRTGGFPDPQHAGKVRRWARPLPPARVRVTMGERAALAFGLGTQSLNIEDYRYAPEANFAFRLVGLPTARGAAIDLVASAPFRDIRDKTVKINGDALAAERYEFNPLTMGEDVFIRGVKPGDVVEIGDASDGRPMAAEDIPYRDGEPPTVPGWEPINLGPACNTSLKRDWWEDESWYGLAAGTRFVWGMPVSLVDPETNGGRHAVRDAGIPVDRRAGALFAVLGRLRDTDADTDVVGRFSLGIEGGREVTVEVREEVPIDLCNGFPLRKFDTYLAAVDLGGNQLVRSVNIQDGTLLALTLATAGSDEAKAALARASRARARGFAERAATYYQTPTKVCADDRPWAADTKLPWRFRLTALPAELDRTDAVLNVREDFSSLLEQVGIEGQADPTWVRAFEVTDGKPSPVPAQFDPISAGDPQRGELLLRMPGRTPAGASRSFDVYFGPQPLRPDAPASSVATSITEDAVSVDTGAGGLRFEFALDGAEGHPRWTFLGFDPGKERNVLGESGFNGGYGDLTCVTDYVSWYAFGHLQSRPARAEIASEGPVATTVRVSDIELWGEGTDVLMRSNVDGTELRASPKGTAEWYFRFRAGSPVVEQWIDFRVDDLEHGWTRAMQVRYGLNEWEEGATRTIDGQAVAVADELAALALPGADTTIEPTCAFTGDGNVIQILFASADALGEYFTGRWVALPPQMVTAAGLASLAAQPVEQFAVEALHDGEVVKKAPTAREAVVFDRTSGRGPFPRPETKEVVIDDGVINPDPSFEQQEVYWMPGYASMAARWTTSHVYSGKVGVDLSCEEDELRLIGTGFRGSREMAVRPNSLYEVTFWAKCTSGEGEVHANFYHGGPQYDFGHVVTPIPADSEWHRVRIELPTGEFPAIGEQEGIFLRSLGIAPALRLWTYHKQQKTYVDHVEVKPLK